MRKVKKCKKNKAKQKKNPPAKRGKLLFLVNANMRCRRRGGC